MKEIKILEIPSLYKQKRKTLGVFYLHSNNLSNKKESNKERRGGDTELTRFPHDHFPCVDKYKSICLTKRSLKVKNKFWGKYAPIDKPMEDWFIPFICTYLTTFLTAHKFCIEQNCAQCVFTKNLIIKSTLN